MKYFVKAAFAVLIASAFTLSLGSCKKEDENEDEGKLPNLALQSGTGYTIADATIAKATAFKVGIVASKAEDKDVLTKFTILRSYDSGADSTIFSKDLTGAEGNNYSYDFNYTTRNTAGKEKYTFTVVNRDGLISKKSITLTVQ